MLGCQLNPNRHRHFALGDIGGTTYFNSFERSAARPTGWRLFTKCAEVYKISPPRTVPRAIRGLCKLDSAVWCDPFQRRIYFSDNEPIEEMVVPYPLRERLIGPSNQLSRAPL